MAEKFTKILVDGHEGFIRERRACQGCGAILLWATTAANRRPIPLNDVPLQAQDNGDGTETVSSGLLHWVTCPKAAEFRRPRG